MWHNVKMFQAQIPLILNRFATAAINQVLHSEMMTAGATGVHAKHAEIFPVSSQDN